MDKSTALVIGIDLMLVNALFLLFHFFGWHGGSDTMWYLVNVFYFVTVSTFKPFAQDKFVRVDQILGRILKSGLMYFFLLATFILVNGDVELDPWRLFMEFGISLPEPWRAERW